MIAPVGRQAGHGKFSVRVLRAKSAGIGSPVFGPVYVATAFIHERLVRHEEGPDVGVSDPRGRPPEVELVCVKVSALDRIEPELGNRHDIDRAIARIAAPIVARCNSTSSPRSRTPSRTKPASARLGRKAARRAETGRELARSGEFGPRAFFQPPVVHAQSRIDGQRLIGVAIGGTLRVAPTALRSPRRLKRSRPRSTGRGLAIPCGRRFPEAFYVIGQ